jgi:hypothetical protein
VAALSEYVDGTALPILRWRPDRSVEPLEVAQSRAWHARVHHPRGAGKAAPRVV